VKLSILSDDHDAAVSRGPAVRITGFHFIPLLVPALMVAPKVF
jgi:hypothetical protein